MEGEDCPCLPKCSARRQGRRPLYVTLRHGLNPHCRALSGYQWQQYCIWLFYSYFGQAEPLFWIKMNLLKKFIEQRVEVDRNKIRWNSPTIRPHFDTSRKSLYLWPQRFILSGRLNVTWIFVIKCYFCAQHNYHSVWLKKSCKTQINNIWFDSLMRNRQRKCNTAIAETFSKSACLPQAGVTPRNFVHGAQ